jgi:Tripartite tricarboxylate transporter family receptor
VIHNQFLFKSLPFDPEKNLEPISGRFFNALALVVNSWLKVTTIADLVALPTLTEARGEHYPSTWFGLFAPAGTPKPITARLAAEVERIVEAPDFRQRMFVDRAVEPAAMKLDEFARFIRDERKNSERIVRESGLLPE